MTAPRLTKRRTKLEKQHADVVSDLITGLKPAEVARKYAVSRSAVHDFVSRHKESISALQLDADRQVESYAIAHKVFRIADLDALYNRSLDFLSQQGFSEQVERFNRDGEVVSRTNRFRDTTMAQLRGLLDDAAKEMGHRITKSGDTMNIAGVINIIRGGTPLGMQPLAELTEAAQVIDASVEDSST